MCLSAVFMYQIEPRRSDLTRFCDQKVTECFNQSIPKIMHQTIQTRSYQRETNKGLRPELLKVKGLKIEGTGSKIT